MGWLSLYFVIQSYVGISGSWGYSECYKLIELRGSIVDSNDLSSRWWILHNHSYIIASRVWYIYSHEVREMKQNSLGRESCHLEPKKHSELNWSETDRRSNLKTSSAGLKRYRRRVTPDAVIVVSLVTYLRHLEIIIEPANVWNTREISRKWSCSIWEHSSYSLIELVSCTN